MNHGGGLHRNGLRTVIKIIPEDNKEWKFIPGFVSLKKTYSESLVQFQYKFDCASTSQVYFAYSFPFGYEDVCKQMDELS